MLVAAIAVGVAQRWIQAAPPLPSSASNKAKSNLEAYLARAGGNARLCDVGTDGCGWQAYEKFLSDEHLTRAHMVPVLYRQRLWLSAHGIGTLHRIL